ncbi:MAG TPA: glycogen debranching N-terminal domain-containing protein, partial [Candidatus Acidoferrum sp.]|nr:glycogen debranching N-terminal domain-containing protein [Candidatus Acidoferrum sp.]
MSQRRDAPAPSASGGDSDRATPIGDPPGQHAASAPAAPIDHPAAAIEQAAPSAPPAAGGTVEAPSDHRRTKRIASAAEDGDGVELVEARSVPIQKATDLGSVRVLKHGNLYLLTDPFGDIHPDSRGLGLYHSDTRLVSCCVLRVGGGRPV